MRAKESWLVLALITNPLCSSAQGVEQLAAKLASIDNFLGNATFEVLLPSAEDPVVYDVSLQSQLPESPDSLAPCDYLIRWQTMAPSGLLEGFSAYFDGHHYRYRNNRLQEYHVDANSSVFQPTGPGSQRKGVQWQAQFADMLPQFIADRLVEIATDTCYHYTFHPDTLVSGRRSAVVQGVKRNMGYDVQNFTYVFDYNTIMPTLIDLETSPGSISEQLVTITYKAPDFEEIELSEDGLMAEWPEVFEKYRQSTFRAENLVGNPLPSFSCQMIGGTDRFSHNRGDALSAPSIFVFLDPAVATTAATIAAVRDAAAMLPAKTNVYWAFPTNNAAEITALLGDSTLPGEYALPSASTLIRNCGITLYPTIMLVNAQGYVKDVLPGYNNDLSSIVIQKAALL